MVAIVCKMSGFVSKYSISGKKTLESVYRRKYRGKRFHRELQRHTKLRYLSGKGILGRHTAGCYRGGEFEYCR